MMKRTISIFIALLFLPLLAFTQDGVTATRFKEVEANAPKGFPTAFVVVSAARSPPSALGQTGYCSMSLETLGKIYDVTAQDTFHACVIFSPGTAVWGRDHRMIDEVLDLLDSSGTKPKSRRYFVQGVRLVDPNAQ